MAEDKDYENVLDPGVVDKVEAALASTVDDPTLDGPQDNIVTLHAGVKKKDLTITTVMVKELDGEDEEILARTAQTPTNNIFHYIDVLLDQGVIRFGQEKPSATENKKYLKQALVGDRDAILLGIRRATYGNEIELTGWICPQCEESSDLTIPLEDIPIHEMDGPPLFTVELRHGSKVEVRLANGSDQIAVFNDTKLNTAERDSLLLSRCLVSITDKDGNKRQAAGAAGSMARKLSVPDRHKILKELNDRQPGPRLRELEIEHDNCGKKVNLGVGIADLFPDFIMG